MRVVGQAAVRTDAAPKLAGTAQYIDDITPPCGLFGAVVRSPVPHGILRAIEVPDGSQNEDLVYVTAADIPGQNVIAAIDIDQPCLVELGSEVSHLGEGVALFAHADRERLAEIVAATNVVVEPLPADFGIVDETNFNAAATIHGGGDAAALGKRHLLAEIQVGTAAARDFDWGAAPVCVEGNYHTGAQEHVYLEPQGVIAEFSADAGLVVHGSMQCPYYVLAALKTLTGLGDGKVRVVQATTGGGFGGKEEYPSVIAGYASLLALAASRPVKMVYERGEDMAVTPKRHPSVTHIKTAHKSDGTLLAAAIDFTLDGGAFTTLTPVVLSRGTLHAMGPYHCPAAAIDSRARRSHRPPDGAFRGFGAPQSIFAIERHMDQVASKLRIAPDELRRRNFLCDGDSFPTGGLVHDGVNMSAVLEQALQESDYRRKWEQNTNDNRESGTRPSLRRGIGLSTFIHGAGFTGAGEKHLASEVELELTDGGCFILRVSSTEIGQGANTVLAQITAETLGVVIDCVSVAECDTASVPDSGPTVASRTTMIVGNLAKTAAMELRQKICGKSDSVSPDFVPQDDDLQAQYISFAQIHGRQLARGVYSQPKELSWDEERYRGDAYPCYAWAAYVAEVEVCMRTFVTRVVDFVAVQEVGRVINPTLARGQIEGGVAQGIGLTLYEKVKWDRGAMANASLRDYIIPMAVDIPPIKVFFHESKNSQYGPWGAKGIGELPLDGVAPAVIAAVENAIGGGASFDRVPLTPEALQNTLDAQV